MLPAKPKDFQVALNRVTFGARDLDVLGRSDRLAGLG